MSKIKVVSRDPKMAVAATIIAENIVEISRGVKAIRASRLNDDALVTLLHRSCLGISRGTIEEVLKALSNLEINYLKKVQP